MNEIEEWKEKEGREESKNLFVSSAANPMPISWSATFSRFSSSHSLYIYFPLIIVISFTFTLYHIYLLTFTYFTFTLFYLFFFFLLHSTKSSMWPLVKPRCNHPLKDMEALKELSMDRRVLFSILILVPWLNLSVMLGGMSIYLKCTLCNWYGLTLVLLAVSTNQLNWLTN